MSIATEAELDGKHGCSLLCTQQGMNKHSACGSAGETMPGNWSRNGPACDQARAQKKFPTVSEPCHPPGEISVPSFAQPGKKRDQSPPPFLCQVAKARGLLDDVSSRW